MSDRKAGIGGELASHDHDLDADYEAFRLSIDLKVANLMAEEGARVFKTVGQPLFDTFLANLPDDDRQVHTCNTCRHFFNRFGGLVTIDSEGKTKSLMWDGAAVPEFYAEAVTKLQKLVERAKIQGQFFSDEDALGISFDGKWPHVAVVTPKVAVNYSKLESANVRMAGTRHDYTTMINALNAYEVGDVSRAISMLSNGSLRNSEVALGNARWFLELLQAYRGTRSGRPNMLWRAISLAPRGFLRVRSSILGSLLDNLQKGEPLASIKAKFEAETAPDKYQRPQNAPTAGHIRVAEKTISALGVQRALLRRYATLDELVTFWLPGQLPSQRKVPKAESVFGHLEVRDKGVRRGELMFTRGGHRRGEFSVVGACQAVPMTFNKFMSKVLPTANKMEMQIPTGTQLPFAAITAPVEADAPPILQWDQEDNRNPYSWYLYVKGSRPAEWNLEQGTYVEVNALTLIPAFWKSETNPNLKPGMIFILDGCRDLGSNAGLALFPQILKNEFHAIHRTIEAYSNEGTLEGFDAASACGLALNDGNEYNYRVRITDVNDIQTVYRIDRWD